MMYLPRLLDEINEPSDATALP